MNARNNRERIPVGDRVTICRRGSKGIWSAEFSLNGGHKRRSLKTQNKRFAIRKATELAAELEAGTYRSELPTKIRDAGDAYIESGNRIPRKCAAQTAIQVVPQARSHRRQPNRGL